MAPKDGSQSSQEIQVQGASEEFNNSKSSKDHTHLHIETAPNETSKRNGFFGTLKFQSLKRMLGNFRSSQQVLMSPSIEFQKLATKRDSLSRSIASPIVDTSITGSLARKINWPSLWKMSKDWIKDPLNLVLLLWIICVAVSGAILFMVMTGMLNQALPKKSNRDTWFEVNNQILNALFTLMCLYQHPRRFYYLALLFRYTGPDVLKLRKIYCKNGTYKPHEWTHMMVVVLLLHINCFAQYALCGLNLGYRRSVRPPIGVAFCLSVAIAAPAIAAVYNILSPLGRDYESESNPESQRSPLNRGAASQRSSNRSISLEKKYSFAVGEGIKPLWVGGLFDLWEDLSTAYLSIFCSFCVFGWNMDRLGFGNMYVHIVTFLLLCLAPFWIFNLAAINIDNETVRTALGLSGIILCVFGLLYGGFWRIQMRKKFDLPSNKFCCRNASVTDCFQWLFCCSCSLAQEVRTADFYDIVENKLLPKDLHNNTSNVLSSDVPCGEIGSFVTSPLSSPIGDNYSPNVKYASPSKFSEAHDENSSSENANGASSSTAIHVTMSAPIPTVIHKI